MLVLIVFQVTTATIIDCFNVKNPLMSEDLGSSNMSQPKKYRMGSCEGVGVDLLLTLSTHPPSPTYTLTPSFFRQQKRGKSGYIDSNRLRKPFYDHDRRPLSNFLRPPLRQDTAMFMPIPYQCIQNF